MTINYSARSHIGKVRKINQDNLFVDGVILPIDEHDSFFTDGKVDVPSVFAVCDGMGGESNGEVASRLSTETLLVFKDRLEQSKPRQLLGIVDEYIKSVGGLIGENTPPGKRMGTTLALAVITRRYIRCFNAGDSRIYYLSNGKIRQITYDHTVGAERSRSTLPSGKTNRPDAALTRCIGIGDRQNAEGYPAIKKNGRMLICSDGLFKMVPDSQIQSVLQSNKSTAETADTLLQSALEKGGRDNITVIVLDINHLKPSLRWPKRNRR